MLHVSRWGPEDAKNGVRVRKLRFFSGFIICLPPETRMFWFDM